LGSSYPDRVPNRLQDVRHPTERWGGDDVRRRDVGSGRNEGL